MSLDRGSEWGKWDLHVHTPLSFESSFGITDEEREAVDPIPELQDIETPDRLDPELWEKYINKLEGIDHVDCLGITDYFSLEGYELINELRENGYLDNFDLILPNIEFRLDTITGDGKRINLHVVFSEDLSVDDIRNEFLRNLKIQIDQSNERTLRPESLRRLGRIARDYHGDDCSDYVAGCKYARVKLDQIINELESTKIFEGKYLILLSGAEWGDINWDGQDAEKKRQLLTKSHGLFSNAPDDLRWATGRKDLSPDDFEDEFGSLKPVFSGSDTHDFESLCEPDQDRYCWLKSDHDFEGLKQVVFEPRDRLEIGASTPQSFTQIQTIRSLSIRDGYVNQQLSIGENELPFNANLITVIGSQGSGKTALLDLIANCFQDRRNTAVNDDNSFIGRIEDSDPRVETEITFEDVDPFTKQAVTENPDFIEGPDISYIPQGKIVEYCEKGDRLHKQIKDLVTSAVDGESSDAIDEFQSHWVLINELTDELRRLNSKLHNINPPEVRSNLSDERASLKQAQTELENKESEIQEFKEKHEAELEETEVEELQDKIDALRDQAEQLGDLEELVKEALTDLESINSFNDRVDKIDSKCSEFELQPNLEKIDLNGQETALETLLEEVENKQQSISKARAEIRDQMEDSTEAEDQLSELREEQRRIEDDIESIENTITELEETVDAVTEIRRDRKDTFVKYVAAYFQQRANYGTITDEFADDDGDILGDVEFKPKIELTGDRVDEFTELLDLRSVNDDDVKEGLYKLRNIISGERPDDLESAVFEYIETMEYLREDMRSEVEPIEFDGLLYDDCLTLSEEIYYQGTPMSQLSRGQKGTVLLKIYLAEGENPLIIDSPEDNLDNRFIYDELIDAIRKAKSNRQIFIATHDANLVVNTDSEQVIISSFSDGQIEYEAGALENPDIRSEAKDILEGGDEAFRRREKKYKLSPQ
ncbi:TrlF family AAA-like ATPase [Halorussus amylolyticus]|uniref:TrlF family AAA-like ATPase n=1 Tax=Halorussus amylolyticus TaxID=1126242 RepID=UPI001051F4B5|nr:AAA family ATPase [Halorussus amylolyticus]